MLSFLNVNSRILPNRAPVSPAKALSIKTTEITPRQYFSANGMLFTVVPRGTPVALSEAPVVDLEDAIANGITLHP